MAEDEVGAVLQGGAVHLLAHSLGAGDVDVPDAHGAELFDLVAVEFGRGHVGVEDRAVLGVDDELHGAVVLEHLPIASFGIAQGQILAPFFDRRRDVLRHEDQDFEVVLGVAGLGAVGLHAHDAPRHAVAAAQRHAHPVEGRRADRFHLAGRPELLELLRIDQHRLAGADDVGRQSPSHRHAAGRIGIALVDEVGEGEEVTLAVERGDVEVARVHERADDAVDGWVEVVEALDLAAKLGDAEEGRLQDLALHALGDVAEVPGPAGEDVAAPHGDGGTGEDAAVLQLDLVVLAHLVRVRVEVIDELDEALPISHFLGRVTEELVVIGERGRLGGDGPDLEEVAVVGEDFPFGVDDEDAIERRFLLGPQDGDGGPQGGAGRALSTTQPAGKRGTGAGEPRSVVERDGHAAPRDCR